MSIVESANAVGREAHVVALEAERADEDIGDVRVVLDDEHAR